MSLTEYLRTLRRGWWIVVVCIGLGAVLALAATVLQTATYQTASTVFVSAQGDGSPTDRASGNNFAVSRALSYAQLATSAAVLEPASASLRGVSLEDLQKDVAAVATADTNIVTITATTGGATRAADEANAVARSLATVVDDLEGGASATTRVDVDIVQAAAVPSVALSPQPRTNLIIGIVIGLAAGLAITVVMQTISTVVRSPSELGLVSSIVPTSIPQRAGDRRRGATPERRREAYRALRTQLRHASGQRGTIAIMSVAHGSDSRDLATGLTLAFGEVGASVLLIDADFRSERLRVPFLRDRETSETPAADGLAGVLSGVTTLRNETTEGPTPNIWHLRPGTPSGSTTQELGSNAMRRLMAEATAAFDYVMIVSPPVLERSEAIVLAAEADTTVVVIAARATKRGDVLFGLERLAGVGVTAPNLVLDDVSRLDMQPSRPVFLGSGNHINTSSAGPLR